MYSGRHQELGKKESFGIETDPSGPARGHRERDDRRRLRRRDQKLGQTAVDRGFRYLPVEGQILKRLTAMGYRRSVVPKSRFQSMDETSTRWISAAGP